MKSNRWFLVAVVAGSLCLQSCLTQAEKAQRTVAEAKVAAAEKQVDAAPADSPEHVEAKIALAVAKAELERLNEEISARRREAAAAAAAAGGANLVKGMPAAAAGGPVGWVSLLVDSLVVAGVAYAAARQGTKANGTSTQATPAK